jgi:pilus assembly protein FimV
MAASKDYGPIERGETLGKIANSVMPEGVTLEQMLVALYRTNPDAFIRKNLNLVRAGKILRVPDRDEVETTVARDDAVREYRPMSPINAYRQYSPRRRGLFMEKRAAVSGKITPKVEDKAARGEPKDVVKLSKGEPAGAAAGTGKARSTAERIRMLEEEAVSREKSLAEANSRIAQLETTIKNMQKLAELRSPTMAALSSRHRRRPHRRLRRPRSPPRSPLPRNRRRLRRPSLRPSRSRRPNPSQSRQPCLRCRSPS